LNLKKLHDSTTLADKILFLTLIVLSLSGIIFIREVLPKSQSVRVEVDGKLLYLLPLDKNRIISVDGPIGKTYIEIYDHRVRITGSPCQNKLCIQQGWMKSGAIVCLPNRVIVTIGNSDETKPIDAST
jgi:hypothetical protein